MRGRSSNDSGQAVVLSSLGRKGPFRPQELPGAAANGEHITNLRGGASTGPMERRAHPMTPPRRHRHERSPLCAQCHLVKVSPPPSWQAIARYPGKRCHSPRHFGRVEFARPLRTRQLRRWPARRTMRPAQANQARSSCFATRSPAGAQRSIGSTVVEHPCPQCSTCRCQRLREMQVELRPTQRATRTRSVLRRGRCTAAARPTPTRSRRSQLSDGTPCHRCVQRSAA